VCCATVNRAFEVHGFARPPVLPKYSLMRSRIVLGSVGLLVATLFLVTARWDNGVTMANVPAGGAPGMLGLVGELPPQEAIAEAPVPEAPSIAVFVTRENRFAWPASGYLTSYFGAGHPTGIDISLPWGEDSPVFASAPGRVSFAGGDACCSYGLHVVLDHEGGLSTLYAHLSEIVVEEGEEVRQGDLLGLGGNTGASDGKHLHFEVQVAGVLADPLRFLPAQQEARYGARTEPTDCQDRALRADPGSLIRIDFEPAGIQGAHLAATAIQSESPAAGAPSPDLEAAGPLSVVLRFDTASAATGQTARFRLDATIAGDGTEETFACWLDFRTMRTLPNSDSTIARYRSRFTSPTPPPTATPVPYVPPPTQPPAPKQPVATHAAITAPPTPSAPKPIQQPTIGRGPPQPIQAPTRTAGR
jgi:hypothetical protein